MTWLKDLLSELLKAISLYLVGSERQKRKQAEENVDVLKKHAEIDQRPDIERPFSGMRDK
jgi:hypothetical protein